MAIDAPYSWLTIDNLRLSPWEKWQGRLVMSLTPQQQDIGYAGKEVTLQARLRGQALTVSEFPRVWWKTRRR
jgi:hypothetical protein